MKKIVVILVCISLLVGQVQAQVVSARNIGSATGAASRQVAHIGQQTANLIFKSSANRTTAIPVPSIAIPATRYRVQVPLMPSAEETARVQDLLARAAVKAAGAENLSFEQIIYRANHGQTAFLPQAVLDLKDPPLREQALRSAFVTAAAAGEASTEQIDVARQFWRLDLVKKLPEFRDLVNRSLASVEDMLPIVQSFQDAAALAMFGTERDITALKNLLFLSDGGGFEPVMATLVVRGLLSQGNWTEVEKFFILYDGEFPELQNGIASYAVKENLPFQINITNKPGQILSPNVSKLLQGWGPVLANATDGSLAATEQWMAWARNRQTVVAPKIAQAPQPAAVTVPLPLENIEPLLPEADGTSAPIQADPLPVAGLPAAQPTTAEVAPGVVPVEQATVVPPDAPIQAGVVIGERDSSLPHQDSLAARMQRVSLYLSAFVMGLEVAAPVVTNFGKSFGLSLENNSLVIAATYAPYSIGALLSDWLKQYLGRKGCMNLGLSMMLAGFAGGVGWVGLDGSFVPEADLMAQFYKALACITLASFGGVFIHNSVGPVMTELNHGASELVRLKRNTYTEFSRSAGMVASFLFPYLATKVLGLDWSFTYVSALPFALAALVGLNVVRIPNTRPEVPQVVPDISQANKNWLEKVKDNPYINLFREDPTALPLLGGLAIYNGVEVTANNAFLYLLPSLTQDPSSQYLFGLVQFAVPFLIGRYLAKCFLTWFPNTSLSKATTLISAGLFTSLLPFVTDNVYLLTSALFFAEIGISTLFTLSFARTAKNPATMDRLTTMIVASALACAVGPMALSSVTQLIMNAGFSATSATTIGMLAIPAALTLLAARLFYKVEAADTGNSIGVWKRLLRFIKNSFYLLSFHSRNS